MLRRSRCDGSGTLGARASGCASSCSRRRPNLMATHGDIESISLRAVASEAGVSATAVYRHFDDHLDLLRESSEYCWANFRQCARRCSAVDRPIRSIALRALRCGLRAVRARSPRPVPGAVLQQACDLEGQSAVVGLAAYQLLVDTWPTILGRARRRPRPLLRRRPGAHVAPRRSSTCGQTIPRCPWPGADRAASTSLGAARSACTPPTIDDRAPRGVESAQDSLRPRNRATLRKPVCATMRWSGRTAWPSMCQPRWSTSIVRASIHLPFSDSRTCAACVIDGV